MRIGVLGPLQVAGAEIGGARVRALLVRLALDPGRVVTADRLIGFVGRTGDVARLRALLDGQDERLVTLVGPGGVGKTRLALETASELDVPDARPCSKAWPSTFRPGLRPSCWAPPARCAASTTRPTPLWSPSTGGAAPSSAPAPSRRP
ncbi:hypothetical protein [Nonomuraea sp. NPDC052265]|uniref:hypothetical protein n=1 Tax=Nonomuraea sp. NPDC052265 TaxID=3364374 RepID=UPI0037C52866